MLIGKPALEITSARHIAAPDMIHENAVAHIIPRIACKLALARRRSGAVPFELQPWQMSAYTSGLRHS